VIVVDTGPLVALCDPRDALHSKARRHLRRMMRARLQTCEAVLVESCFHLPHGFQRRRLRALLDELPILVVAPKDPAFLHGVFEWLDKYAEHEPDWADGCIAVCCDRDDALKVWTYDREFRTVWRKPDGKAIPLAVKE
jgi:predicted nucleic acid-binding protein